MTTTNTLLDIRTQCRDRADMANTNFISDTELNSYINASIAELYDLLVATFADYYIEDEIFTLTGTNLRAVPADFYKLRGLDFRISNQDWITLYKYNFTRRNLKNRDIIRTYRGEPTRQYRLMGTELRIEPEDQADGQYRLWYIPAFTPLALDADTFDSVNHWIEYVVVDSAMKMLQKEESDTSLFERQKFNLVKRIEAMAAERDAGEPETVADVQADTFFDSDSNYPWG